MPGNEKCGGEQGEKFDRMEAGSCGGLSGGGELEGEKERLEAVICEVGTDNLPC